MFRCIDPPHPTLHRLFISVFINSTKKQEQNYVYTKTDVYHFTKISLDSFYFLQNENRFFLNIKITFFKLCYFPIFSRSISFNISMHTEEVYLRINLNIVLEFFFDNPIQ